MADWNGSGSRKHKWLSPPEISPNKYLRSSESRRVTHSKERNSESPSPSQNRRVTCYPHESTPRRRLDIGNAVRSTVRARSRHMDELRPHSDDRHADTSGELLELECDHEEKRNKSSGTISSNEEQSPQTPSANASALLFKRAFGDILGTPSRLPRSLDRETRRSLEGKQVEHRRSLEGKQVEHRRSLEGKQVEHRRSLEGKQVEKRRFSDPDELQLSRSGSKSTTFKKEVVSERKQRSVDLKRDLSPRRMVINVTPKQEADVLPKTTRLVFLDEDSDKDEDTTRDLADNDPSIGSDFSDIGDVESLTQFSQEDMVSPCCSMQEDPRPSTSHYKSPWKRYTEQSSSSPMYRPRAEKNIWRQKERDSSYMSETSLLDSSYLSVSSDIESPGVKSHKRSGSFDSPRLSDQTTKPFKRSVEILPSSPDHKFLDAGFIDTHCHLDMLFARLSHRSSFANFRDQYYSTFPQEFHGCITDYCDPRTLNRLPWQQVLDEDLVWGAFGCHPHFAQYYDNRLHEDMMQALRHPKAIAFGEMGLDYSHKCYTKVPDQMAVFEKQLKLVVPLGKPLVIHCRGADKDLFKIMKKWLPRDYKIHRHCFTGKYEEIEPFLNEFPNMAVGFTAVLTYPSAVEAQDAVTRIPLDRLIVETDAPFFLPKQVPKWNCKFAHPGMALHTVREIAKLRNLPVKTVMSQLRENTYRLYNI